MKRKVIQLAGKTLVVSLPSKWAKERGIKKGNEIDITEEGKYLRITTEKLARIEPARIDITGLEHGLAWRYINAAYIKGSGEIEVVYDKPGSIELVQKIAPTLIGCAIVKEGRNYCIIKDLSGANPEEFETILRRIFLMLNQIADDVLAAAKEQDYDALEKMKFRDYSLNYFVNYCLRCLFRQGHSKKGELFAAIKYLEGISDEYADLSTAVSAKKLKPGRSSLQILENVNKMLREFYECYYQFDKEKTVSLMEKRRKLNKEVEELITKSKEDSILLYHIRSINIFILNLLEIKLIEEV